MLYKHLLCARYVLFNIVAVALLLAAYLQSWLDSVINAHLRELSALIFIVFLYGLVICGLRVWRNSTDLNDVKAGTAKSRSQSGRYLALLEGASAESRATLASALRLKLADQIVVVRDVANGLIFLGLIGTVIGFIVALSGIDPAAATQVESVTTMVATMVNGMSVALNTTLVGAVLYIWLIVNYRILVAGAVDLVALTMELGEARARA